jgi:pyruvate dehydrogenase E2 component (dihydrolipoamide acetyltransferase)
VPTDFRLPELGENLASGDVLRVLVKPGEVLAKDQPVLELETDKATIEVPSSVSGRVVDVRVNPGDRITVGQTILTVDEDATQPAPPGAAAAAPTAVEPKGWTAAAGTPSSDVDEAKGTVPDRPPHRLHRGEVVDINRGVRPPVEPPLTPGPTAAPAAPSVRRLARELGVDISQVAGSGPGGRISLDDVKAHTRAVMSSLVAAGRGPVPRLPDFGRWGAVERRPMQGVRRKTAEHVSAAWATIPRVTQHDLADITALDDLRKAYAKRAEKADRPLTMTAVALKAIAAALKMFPQFNASVDMAAEEIVFRQSIHIGVAVDTDRGLLVPVIRDVDGKSVLELAAEVAGLAEKARAHKLSLEEMQGGGFTITNLGSIGGTFFTPIVNAPEVAILGMSRASIQPVYRDGQFVPRLMLPLSLSYDHRVIDGADGVRFLRRVVEALEQPFLLVLPG